MTEGGDSSDDPQLKSLRAVWLAMPDEEPPTRGLDVLMAAARAQAEVFASPPWWKRALHVLARPPVLALATIMILVGGAVLISSRDAVKDAGPTVGAPPAAAPAIAPPAETPAIVPKVPEPTLQPDPTPAKKLEVEHSRPEPTDVKASKPKPAPVRSEPHASGRTGADPSYTPDGERPKSKIDGLATPATEPATDDKAADEAEAAQTRAPTPRQVIVDQLLVQCRSAATRGDCEEAKLIARRIAAQSTAFYKDHVATDATIQKCITPPAAAAPAQ